MTRERVIEIRKIKVGDVEIEVPCFWSDIVKDWCFREEDVEQVFSAYDKALEGGKG